MYQKLYLKIYFTFLLTSSVHSKCFRPSSGSFDTRFTLLSNGRYPNCNLCGLSSDLSDPSIAEFQSSSLDVLKMLVRCALVCASILDCVGFNYRTVYNVYPHCQFFNYTPLIYISNDFCIYHHEIVSEVKETPG
ncbi:hypothetical protein HELRODRAFT_174043 [Helobdella robusta]|uniref:Uncharacterized protein n=1 Tax=Helobdella robusta TaxID=6412 RepID=T1F7I8_HELRO|nr:hypothetical protein HELRODRAFT_174043 [Helobdella robusta]ESO03150.1 hypothetical protein HELRODRAFT_174043 [Helobdella robusta]